MSGEDGVVLKYEGNKEVLAAFARLQNKPQRLHLFEAIGAYGRSSTQRRFDLGIGPDGKPWKKSQRVLLFGGRTLVDHAYLLSSLTYDKSESATEWGSPLIYAPIQQLGGKIVPKNKASLAFRLASGEFVQVKSVTLAARPYLGIDEKDDKRIAKICMDYLSKVIQ